MYVPVAIFLIVLDEIFPVVFFSSLLLLFCYGLTLFRVVFELLFLFCLCIYLSFWFAVPLSLDIAVCICTMLF